MCFKLLSWYLQFHKNHYTKIMNVTSMTINQHESIYCIYLIKRPGVYFRSKFLEGAFKRGGRLLLCLLQNSCTAAVIVLFLGCCLSLNLFLSLNLSHIGVPSVSVSLSLPSMHHKKYYYSMLPCLQLGSMCYFSSTHSATPHNYMGDYLIWAVIDKDRVFTLGV